MLIADAYEICRPINQTLDLAERLIGAERLMAANQEKQADVAPAYRMASRELESLACTLHAHARGMVSADLVPDYVKQAREALDRMEAALRGGA